MGYEPSLFLNPVHKELICAICFGIFEKPVYLPLCRHVFCSKCISDWLNQSVSNNNCPIDKTQIKISKEEVIKKRVSFALQNIISDQIVMCKYKRLGCTRTFTLSAFSDHLKECTFKPANAADAETSFNNLSIDNNSTANVNAAPAAAVPQPEEAIVPNVSNTSNVEQKNAMSSAAVSNNTTPNNNKKSDKKSKQRNLCKKNHPFKSNASVYVHTEWSHAADKKLVELTFLGIFSSYKPYTLASYIKNIIGVDVYCIHTDLKFENSLTKDLSVFVLEQEHEKILKPELWPTKVTIQATLEFKQTTVKGSLKTLRRTDFFGFNERNEERKERKVLNKMKRVERLAQKDGDKKSRRNKKQAKESTKNNDVSNENQSAAKEAKANDEEQTVNNDQAAIELNGNELNNQMDICNNDNAINNEQVNNDAESA